MKKSEALEYEIAQGKEVIDESPQDFVSQVSIHDQPTTTVQILLTPSQKRQMLILFVLLGVTGVMLGLSGQQVSFIISEMQRGYMEDIYTWVQNVFGCLSYAVCAILIFLMLCIYYEYTVARRNICIFLIVLSFTFSLIQLIYLRFMYDYWNENYGVKESDISYYYAQSSNFFVIQTLILINIAYELYIYCRSQKNLVEYTSQLYLSRRLQLNSLVLFGINLTNLIIRSREYSDLIKYFDDGGPMSDLQDAYKLSIAASTILCLTMILDIVLLRNNATNINCILYFFQLISFTLSLGELVKGLQFCYSFYDWFYLESMAGQFGADFAIMCFSIIGSYLKIKVSV